MQIFSKPKKILSTYLSVAAIAFGMISISTTVVAKTHQPEMQIEGDIDAADAPWMVMKDKRGNKVSVRYYNEGDNDYADLELNGKTYGLSKITEDAAGNPVYGDGKKTTMISYGGGGSVEVIQGKRKTIYR